MSFGYMMWIPVIYQKMPFGYVMWKVYAAEPRPPTGRHWIGRASGAGVVALVGLITLAFLKVSCIPKRSHRSSHLSVHDNIKLLWGVIFFKTEKNKIWGSKLHGSTAAQFSLSDEHWKWYCRDTNSGLQREGRRP